MKTHGEFGHVTLTRASDGAQVLVPNGTLVQVLDDLGDKRRHKNRHTNENYWPVMYADELHFADAHSLVRRNAGQHRDE